MKIGYLMQAGVPDVRQRPLSGPAIHVKHVFQELQGLGHQVRLLAQLDQQLWKSDDLENFEPVSLPHLTQGPFRLFERVVRRIQSQFKIPYAAFFESLRFAQACRQELAGFDLLYERMGWFGYGGGLASRWLNIPLIFEVNGDHLSEFEMLGIAPQGLQRWLSTRLMKTAIDSSTLVVAAGQGWQSRFLERWQLPTNKVTVVENGSEVVNLLKREQLRAFNSAGNPSQPVTVVFIGAFDPWQGLTVLLKAIARVAACRVPIHLLLIGGGKEEATLKRMIAELGLESCVTFTGQLPPHEFVEYFAQADIAVSPYCGRANYSGLKLLDYKAAGLPTIASGKDGQPDILKHEQTGWIVPPCDEEALCEAIVRLATDTELRQHIGREARLEAEQYHSWRHTAQQLEALFLQATTS